MSLKMAQHRYAHLRYRCKYCRRLFTGNSGWTFYAHLRHHEHDIKRYWYTSRKRDNGFKKEITKVSGNTPIKHGARKPDFKKTEIDLGENINKMPVFELNYQWRGVDMQSRVSSRRLLLQLKKLSADEIALKVDALSMAIHNDTTSTNSDTKINSATKEVGEKFAKNLTDHKTLLETKGHPAYRFCNKNCKQTDKTMNSNTKKRYHCQYCERCFSQKGGLDIHERIHLGYKPFRCEMCDSTFYDKSNLKKHLRIHTGDAKFYCKYCESSFTDPGNLKKHEQTHLNVSERKTFNCPYCKKILTSKDGLIKHVRTHTGEKPFACAYCDKSFATRPERKWHEYIHTRDKPYKCTFEGCTKRFEKSSKLVCHMRIHTGEKPYECDLCGQRFPRGADRTLHRRLHFKENFYKCAYCARSYKTLSGLKYHKNAEHFHVRPYTCKYVSCGMSFFDQSTRRKHHLRCRFKTSSESSAKSVKT